MISFPEFKGCASCADEERSFGEKTHLGPIAYNFYRRKTTVILTSFFFYGKVNGKIIFTGVFRFCQSFFSGKSFMQ